MIPNLIEFIVTIIVLVGSFGLTPILQSFFLRFDAYLMYPFVCPKCFNFWMNLIIMTLLAYIFNPFFLMWGFITSVIIAVCYITTENKFKIGK